MSQLSACVDAVFQRFAQGVQPGCAVGVIRDGALVHAAGYGYADVAGARRIDADTVFNIASTSKQFTAFALLVLACDGRLSLDDPVRKFVPELPTYADAVTLRQLMHHTGGLRSYLELLLLSGRAFAERTTCEDALAMIVRQRGHDDEPGHAFAYSNTGYFLLSVVIERVSGQSMKDFSQVNIFSPLGMTSTSIIDSYPVDIARAARGYSVSEHETRIDKSAWEQTGDGQVHTSVRDLALWDANFYTPRVGGSAVIDAMLRSGVLNDGHSVGYGGGLFLSRRGGLTAVSHGGGWAGYRSDMLRFPERKLSVIVLSNRADTPASELAEAVAQIYLGLVDEELPAPLPQLLALRSGADVRPRLSGTFRGDAGQYVAISAHAQGTAIAWGGEAYALAERLDGLLEFKAGGDLFFCVLHRALDGTVHLAAQLYDQIVDFVAVEPWAPDLAQFSGRYASEECDGHIELRIERGELAAHLLGKMRRLQPGMAGELMTGDGIVLRAPPAVAPGMLVFASWGLRGLAYRRLD